MRGSVRRGAGWKGTPWIVGTLVLLAGTLAVFFFTGNPSTEAATVSQDYSADISAGPPDAKVVLVEYADFQCGACAGYASILKPLRAEYKDDVLFVFRFFPLENHEWAMASSQVAYAAYLQGKFWEMHDVLYENQDDWAGSDDPRPFFDAYATLLGLDIERFHADANAQSTLDFIDDQTIEATEGGINHTPWFLLNGETIQPRDEDGFRELIEDQL